MINYTKDSNRGFVSPIQVSRHKTIKYTILSYKNNIINIINLRRRDAVKMSTFGYFYFHLFNGTTKFFH